LIYSFVDLFIYLFIYLFIDLLIYSFIHLFIYLFTYLFIYANTKLPKDLPMLRDSWHSHKHTLGIFIYLFMHLFMYSFVYVKRLHDHAIVILFFGLKICRRCRTHGTPSNTPSVYIHIDVFICWFTYLFVFLFIYLLICWCEKIALICVKICRRSRANGKPWNAPSVYIHIDLLIYSLINLLIYLLIYCLLIYNAIFLHQ